MSNKISTSCVALAVFVAVLGGSIARDEAVTLALSSVIIFAVE